MTGIIEEGPIRRILREGFTRHHSPSPEEVEVIEAIDVWFWPKAKEVEIKPRTPTPEQLEEMRRFERTRIVRKPVDEVSTMHEQLLEIDLLDFGVNVDGERYCYVRFTNTARVEYDPVRRHVWIYRMK